jgi:hypothetical protein
MRQALHYRRRVVEDSNALRLIYAEADGFPVLLSTHATGIW